MNNISQFNISYERIIEILTKALGFEWKFGPGESHLIATGNRAIYMLNKFPHGYSLFRQEGDNVTIENYVDLEVLVRAIKDFESERNDR